MPTFRPNGKCETVLERLVEGDCSFISLANACGVGLDRKGKKDLHWIIGSLLKCELVGGRRERFYILPAGRRVLDGLRGQNSIVVHEPTTSVRLFA